MELNIIFYISIFLAEIIGTIAGFGSSTILLPIALFFFNFQTALVIVSIVHLSGNIGRLLFFKKNINKNLFINFGIPSIILALIGALLVNQLSQSIFKFILGIFLIIFVLLSLLTHKIKLKLNKRNAILGGSLSGFFAGLIGTGGALRGAFLTAFDLKKSTYIATISVISLTVDLTRVPVYLFNNFLPLKLYLFLPLIFIIAFAGTYIGKKLVFKMNKKLFTTVVLTLIGLAGIKLLIESVF